MQTEEFLNHVQDRGGLPDRDQAAKVSEVVLNVFGQLRLDGEANDVAAQLPKDIAHMLRVDATPEKFDAAEFIARLQQRLDSTPDEASLAATAVLSTVSEAVTEGERVEFANQLPNDFTPFTTRK